MLNSLSSNAIDAKARAIYGRRLTTANYRELMHQRTVSDAAAYLKTTQKYGKYLANINETQIHRGQLEDILHKSKLYIYTSFCHYDFSKAQLFYRFAVANSEVSLLLRALMLINSGSPQSIIPELPTFMEGYYSFDFMALSKCNSFADLLHLLEGTPYHDVLKPFLTIGSAIDLADCELALKTYYYQSMLDAVDASFRKKDRQKLREIVLTEIELVNFSLIYRLKTYFKLPPEEIKRRLLPFRLKLTSAAIDNLIAAQTDGAFVTASPIKSGKNAVKPEFEYIEEYTKRLRYVVCRRALRTSVSAPLAYFAIMALSQIEIENITVIVEGIRYGLDPNEIEKLLILE